VQIAVVIGAGKVGTATANSLSTKVDIHDPALGFEVDSFNNYTFIFVCVDTLRGGPSDYKSLDSVLTRLSNDGVEGIVIVRSTLSPEYAQDVLITNYPNLRVVLLPEFMTDAQLRSDNPEDRMTIIGGDSGNVRTVRNFLTANKSISPASSVREVSLHEAALIKLSANAILATKVVTFNAIKLIADDYDANYDVVRDALSLDKRLGAEYHSVVPSPDDGKYGFGGDCLPKDTKAIASIEPCGFFAGVLKVNECLGR
jgi:UDPglucose 6-dehydrogenase